MTIKQVSIKSGLSEQIIRREIILGSIQAYRPKGRYIVEDHPASLRDWLEYRQHWCGVRTVEERRWLQELVGQDLTASPEGCGHQ
jgi:hypothetical protein